MTEVLQSPSHFPSTSSSSTPCAPPTPNDGSNPSALINSPVVDERVQAHLGPEEEEEEEGGFERKRIERDREGDQVSVVELLIAAFRRSLIGCSNTEGGKLSSSSAMEIGWPSNVRHVAHVTFDRFNGFLGLPVEFEPEVPRRPPSARSVFKNLFFSFKCIVFDNFSQKFLTFLSENCVMDVNIYVYISIYLKFCCAFVF